jgi:murein DD-endopeptidase MepM/ murein hydrolase activator NlpD
VNILEVITSVPGRNLDIQPPDDTGDWLNQGNVWWNRKTSEFAKKPKYVDKYDAPPDATTANIPSNNSNTPTVKTPTTSGTANTASAEYSIIWPAGNKSMITPNREFGNGHGGVDIQMAVGTPVVAPEDGTIIDTKEDKAKAGLYVKLRSKDGQRIHNLLHMSRIECYDNQTVKQGQRLGLSGGAKGAKGAGNSTGPHLHWAITVNGQPKNPIEVADASKNSTTKKG